MIRPALLLACCLAPLLLLPAASAATMQCVPLKNPNDGQSLACAGYFTTSRGANCYVLVADPPVPGMYTYFVQCGPDGQTIEPCYIPVIHPEPCE